MPQIPYRANLSAADFPLTLAKSGRSVIIPGYDQVYNRQVDPQGESGQAGIPQAIYLENVIPTPQGYQSVGFRQELESIKATTLYQVLEIGGVIFNPFSGYLFIYNDGTVETFQTESSTFGAVSEPVNWLPMGATNLWGNFSSASVAGRVFILHPYGLLENTFEMTNPTTIVGAVYTGVITLGVVISICASFNYQILLNTSGIVYWSSTTDPTDFTPSLVTGAGSEIPSGMRGVPLFLKEHPTGFLIYTTENVISAQYTGNARYPFKFREVPNSSGYLSQWNVSGGQNAAQQIGITLKGQLQGLGPGVAEPLFGDLSDFFMNSKTYDVFDSGNNTFTTVKFQPIPVGVDPIYKVMPIVQTAVWYIQDNFVIFSYSITPIVTAHDAYVLQDYSYAFIYDIRLKRWGKIKFNHCYVFGAYGSIYFVQRTNATTCRLYTLNTDIYNITTAPHSGVIVLGKIQLVRSRLLKLEELDIESTQDLSVQNPKSFSTFLLPTLDGKNFLPSVTPYLMTNAGALLSYRCHTVGMNISIGMKGAFDLSSVSMKITAGGNR